MAPSIVIIIATSVVVLQREVERRTRGRRHRGRRPPLWSRRRRRRRPPWRSLVVMHRTAGLVETLRSCIPVGRCRGRLLLIEAGRYHHAGISLDRRVFYHVHCIVINWNGLTDDALDVGEDGGKAWPFLPIHVQHGSDQGVDFLRVRDIAVSIHVVADDLVVQLIPCCPEEGGQIAIEELVQDQAQCPDIPRRILHTRPV
mmetsp:Transcript_79441/g.190757  ORF Transcript_79441/g.190757 Transcript_79441/m.190757 type:complete len:200 (+) Transcript_79441:383-982(+)